MRAGRCGQAEGQAVGCGGTSVGGRRSVCLLLRREARTDVCISTRVMPLAFMTERLIDFYGNCNLMEGEKGKRERATDRQTGANGLRARYIVVTSG